MSALSFPILQRETASRSLSPTAGRNKEQLLWKNICRRQTDLFSYQIGFQFVGLVKTLSPLRPQAEVEPWNFHSVARAKIASASADIDHVEDIALEVVVPNYSIYGRTPTVSEVFACLRVGVWHYTHKTHKDSHKTWVCVSAFCAYKIHKAHKSRHKTEFTPQASPILFE